MEALRFDFRALWDDYRDEVMRCGYEVMGKGSG